eukprot:1115295-Pyramimonas_sp.AAC.1
MGNKEVDANMQMDHMVWMGDMNYRLDVDLPVVVPARADSIDSTESYTYVCADNNPNPTKGEAKAAAE